MREVEVFVVLADVLSCGTEVQEVNKQLPAKTRRAEIRNFFIGYALGVETLRASKKLQALNPLEPAVTRRAVMCCPAGRSCLRRAGPAERLWSAWLSAPDRQLLTRSGRPVGLTYLGRDFRLELSYGQRVRVPDLLQCWLLPQRARIG